MLSKVTQNAAMSAMSTPGAMVTRYWTGQQRKDDLGVDAYRPPVVCDPGHRLPVGPGTHAVLASEPLPGIHDLVVDERNGHIVETDLGVLAPRVAAELELELAAVKRVLERAHHLGSDWSRQPPPL